jgi:hypothetical protein
MDLCDLEEANTDNSQPSTPREWRRHGLAQIGTGVGVLVGTIIACFALFAFLPEDALTFIVGTGASVSIVPLILIGRGLLTLVCGGPYQTAGAGKRCLALILAPLAGLAILLALFLATCVASIFINSALKFDRHKESTVPLKREVTASDAQAAAESFMRHWAANNECLPPRTQGCSHRGGGEWEVRGEVERGPTFGPGIVNRPAHSEWKCVVAGRADEAVSYWRCKSISVDGKPATCPSRESAFYRGLPVE